MNDYTKRIKEKMIEDQYSAEYISQVVKYSENLINQNLPVIFDSVHLALYLNLPHQSLKKIIYNRNSKYLEKEIKSKSGKRRRVYIPKSNLKDIQYWILHAILYNAKINDCAKGFKLGSSIKNNAEPHVGKEYVLNLDLKNFFATIKEDNIKSVFISLGYNKDVSNCLAKLCSYRSMLPQGAPSSPYLSNLASNTLDQKILKVIVERNISYTRYADDLTFSSNEKLESLIPVIKTLLQSEGFKLNDSKTRIRNKNQRQLVTGLVVNEKVNIQRKYIRNLRTEIFYCKKYGVSGHMKRKGINKSNYKLHLYGKALYIKMIDRERGEKIIEELDGIQWQY